MTKYNCQMPRLTVVEKRAFFDFRQTTNRFTFLFDTWRHVFMDVVWFLTFVHGCQSIGLSELVPTKYANTVSSNGKIARIFQIRPPFSKSHWSPHMNDLSDTWARIHFTVSTQDWLWKVGFKRRILVFYDRCVGRTAFRNRRFETYLKRSLQRLSQGVLKLRVTVSIFCLLKRLQTQQLSSFENHPFPSKI